MTPLLSLWRALALSSSCRSAAVVSIAFALWGCAVDSPRHTATTDRSTLPFAPGEHLTVWGLPSLGQIVDAAQLVTIQYGDERLTFETRLSVTPDQLRLVALDAAGRRLMTLGWTDTRIVADFAPGLPSSLRPQSLLADLLLLYWPNDVLQAAMEPGVEVATLPPVRTVRRGEKELVRIRYGWLPGAALNGTANYINYGWGYEIEIRSRDLGE